MAIAERQTRLDDFSRDLVVKALTAANDHSPSADAEMWAALLHIIDRDNWTRSLLGEQVTSLPFARRYGQTTEQPSSSTMETVRAEGSLVGDSPQGSTAAPARLVAGGAR